MSETLTNYLAAEREKYADEMAESEFEMFDATNTSAAYIKAHLECVRQEAYETFDEVSANLLRIYAEAEGSHEDKMEVLNDVLYLHEKQDDHALVERIVNLIGENKGEENE